MGNGTVLGLANFKITCMRHLQWLTKCTEMILSTRMGNRISRLGLLHQQPQLRDPPPEGITAYRRKTCTLNMLFIIWWFADKTNFHSMSHLGSKSAFLQVFSSWNFSKSLPWLSVVAQKLHAATNNLKNSSLRDHHSGNVGFLTMRPWILQG